MTTLNQNAELSLKTSGKKKKLNKSKELKAAVAGVKLDVRRGLDWLTAASVWGKSC